MDRNSAWNGWKSHGLKPAYEPIIVAMKPNGEPAIDIFQAVCYTLNKNGFNNIVWKEKPVKNAGEQKTLNSSTKTKPPKMEATFVENAKKRETQNQGQNTEQAYLNDKENDMQKTQKPPENIKENEQENKGKKQLKSTEENASVVENRNMDSSQLTTSTMTAKNIEKKSDDTLYENLSEKDIRKTTSGFSVSTAISLVKSTDNALIIIFEDNEYTIERLPDNVFIWPDNLPKYRKGSPLSYAQNALKHGVSGLNIDGGRVGGETMTESRMSQKKGGILNANGRDVEHGNWKQKSNNKPSQHQGRFPSNVILDPEAAEMLDEQSGESKSVKAPRGGTCPAPMDWGNSRADGHIAKGHSDSGGASRFFYTAKASKEERDKTYSQTKNNHPTVKSLKLMEYLCVLTETPTKGIVLDPFMGSWTTALACKNTGRDFIGFELEEDYCKIGEKRLCQEVMF